MIGQIARRAAVRSAPVRRQTRTLMDSPNPVKEQQKNFQKGATPYLRGEADPTYLRKSSDGPVATVAVATCAFLWLSLGYNHYRMWNEQK